MSHRKRQIRDWLRRLRKNQNERLADHESRAPPLRIAARQRPQSDTKALRFRGAFCLMGTDATGNSLNEHGTTHGPSRVVVVGANGAGKTWFAQALGARVGAPVIHKDAFALMTDWHQRPGADVKADVLHAVASERWVLEGGPSILSKPILAHATLVVWLDIPTPLRAWRVFYRSLRYLGRTRPEHPAGNRDWPGIRQSRFLWRALVGGDRFAAAITHAMDGATVPRLRLRTKAEISAFIEAAGEGAERF